MGLYEVWIGADGGDGLRAALVEVTSSGLDNLSASQLTNVCSQARLPLTAHQVISIHRHLSRSPASTATSPEALLRFLGIESEN